MLVRQTFVNFVCGSFPRARAATALRATATIALAGSIGTTGFVTGICTPSFAAGEDFVNFESSQVHPIALSADRTKLYALNTPDDRLAVFDVAGDGSLGLSREFSVGIDPVSLAVRGNEVWVVNHISDSISIVDVAAGKLVATIQTGDEPTDIVFANGRAFVSHAGARDHVRFYDAATRSELGQPDI